MPTLTRALAPSPLSLKSGPRIGPDFGERWTPRGDPHLGARAPCGGILLNGSGWVLGPGMGPGSLGFLVS